MKEFLKDPSKFAAVAAPASQPVANAGGKAAPAAETKKAPEPESDDDDMGGLDIFG
jgi:large subunit ribosomal protein LP0